MKYFADFHIHSHYSRATSKNLNLETLYQWAKIKGIQVIGTGDFTHPGWIAELEEKLEPDGNGLFRLKEPPKEEAMPDIRTNGKDIRFCLSTEISSIYKYGEKVRKNHNIVLVPDFDTAKKLNARLSQIGNLASDGRPILGLPSRDLLEIVLETSDDAHLIPAHVWTPWFSTLGSKAGYDSIKECFRDLSEHIFALETGLSSDPAMNWKVSSLDKYALVSNSDAHSPQKLGREANIFDTELSYYAMFGALKTKKGFLGTYEFFPEEGKYHMDGHRKCNICLDPHETIKLNNICPVCGKPLTIGVLNRVEKLADREMAQKPEGAPGFDYIIPLPEIIAEFTGTAPTTKSVQQTFSRVISTFGNEFDLLHTIPVDEIKSRSGELLAEAIRRLRTHEVNPQAGYDGEYGIISIFNPGEIEQFTGQTDLFGGGLIEKMTVRKARKQAEKTITAVEKKDDLTQKPNEQQQLAIQQDGNTLVTAGPGTGKTNTLVRWIIHQIEEKNISPRKIIAITFTNKSADELKERLQKQIGDKASGILVGTFHAVAYRFLKEMNPDISTIYDKSNRINLFRILFPKLDKTKINKLSTEYEAFNEGVQVQIEEESQAYFETYQQYLSRNQAVDLSAIIGQTNEQLRSAPGIVTQSYRCLAVDEFQDINPVQYEFVKLISKDKQVFAIGDPNQSIYGFRGSDIELFFRIKEDLQANEISLKKNYRTPPVILKAAQMLVSRNRQKAETEPEAVKTSNTPIKHFPASDSRQEAAYIADQVLNYIGGVDSMSTGQHHSDYNYAFSDIAILYRTHRVADEIISQLKIKGIPVLLSDGTSFFSEPPFDVISNALQLLQNRNNVVAVSGMAERLNDTEDKQKRLKDYLDGNIDFENFSPQKRWKEWIGLYNRLAPVFEKENIQQTIQELLDFFLPESVLDGEQQIKKEMIVKLAADSGEKPADFLQKYILSPYTDTGRLRSGGVRLMTFHAAKGLEFPVVFIAGAEEGITPVDRKDTDMEEERRLFYVAMTRAKDELQIVHSRKRKIFGSEKEMMPSRFLNELDPQFLQQVSFAPKKQVKPDEKQLSLF